MEGNNTINNNNLKKLLFVDKKEINLQSRNNSYLNMHEKNSLRKTFSNEGKLNIQNNSYTKLDLLKKNNIRSSDSNRNMTNSAEKRNRDIKEKEVDLSKFKSKQQKYTEIYNNNRISNNDVIDKIQMKSHIKSRNPNNNIIAKDTTDKHPLSKSVNIPGGTKKPNNIITSTFHQKTYQLFDKKNGLNNSVKPVNHLIQKEMIKNNFLINNYLKKKNNSNTKVISLKKPTSIANLSMY